MAAKNSDRTVDAIAMLQQIVEQAVDAGADEIDVERVPEGLEITPFSGATGILSLLSDDELENALFEWVEANAAKSHADRDVIEIKVHGQSRTLGLEWYDSFGETCFRINLRRPAKKSKRRRMRR